MAKIDHTDLSGTSTPITSNPYDGLLQVCNNDPILIQSRYHLHRTTRNAQQKDKILSPDFPGWTLDKYLIKLDGPPGLKETDSGFTDPRNCLVFWARPPQKVRNLIDILQQKLRAVVPDIWLMPLPNLHMTAMEISHSLTASEIESMVTTLLPNSHAIADLPAQPHHRARLVKPFLSFDAAALALSFVPAAGEALPVSRPADDDKFTYHHLRRILYEQISASGVPVGSRYALPSAHLTIARMNSPNPFDPSDPLDAEAGRTVANRKKLIREIEMINAWLEAEFWPKAAKPDRLPNLAAGDEVKESDMAKNSRRLEVAEERVVIDAIKPGGEWIIGEEKGLDFRKGTLWYGGGETVYIGKGIAQA